MSRKKIISCKKKKKNLCKNFVLTNLAVAAFCVLCLIYVFHATDDHITLIFQVIFLRKHYLWVFSPFASNWLCENPS